MPIFPVPGAPEAAIAGSTATFPVRRIYCVGRNYAAHAREMGKDPDRDPPFFFTKFSDSIVPSGSIIAYPPETQNFHYEAELVVAIGKAGRAASPEEALAMVYGYAVGLDMTRRDLQLEAREQGRPWDMGKNFAQSAPLAPIHPVSEIGHLEQGAIKLAVNGEIKQSADIADLIWDVPEVIQHLTRYGPLEQGDLIFTGTPDGVGPVVSGDRIEVTIERLNPLEIQVGDKA